MRATVAVALAALLCLGPQQANAQPVAAQCQPGALGVSRVVEIDTSRGGRYGHVQYKDIDFLREGEVVLTFDDGPSRAHTPSVLAALEAHCTKATFFSTGRMAISDPQMLRETARRGHTIGTHTWSHKNLKAISAAQARHEIELGFSAVQAALGEPIAPFFRFPYLSDPQSMQSLVQERGIAIFSIDVDSYDFRTPSAAVMQRNVLNQLASRKKGIILFHDIQGSTARGIKGLLDELKARNFRIVHIVPKNPAATVAEFDAIAEKSISGRRVAETSNPMNKRSVVWPVTPTPAAASTAAAAPAAPPAPPAQRPVHTEDDWRTKVFGR